MRILYGQKCDHADLLPAVPSVTTLNFRRPPSVTTFNFSVTTLSCTPGPNFKFNFGPRSALDHAQPAHMQCTCNLNKIENAKLLMLELQISRCIGGAYAGHIVRCGHIRQWELVIKTWPMHTRSISTTIVALSLTLDHT